ncbi:hypothetical protein QO010_002932 [Caulobacter ginsengisoli]|uniref:DUF6891 domain-containing protein n=1 Tax=Caulobacter ginsengisoli TaxID=400775 RepID=A0ABU0IVJ4_9CAUL|nr:hypothetical protein [Caulobacter ginsengisoli]MDQ0465148.1 hypothetical protein [Caulobacter ginsengisoli]
MLKFLKSLLDRLSGSPSPAPLNASQDAEPDWDTAAEMRAYIERAVAGGFETRDEILQTCEDMAEDILDRQQFRNDAQGYLAERLQAHRAEQATWPEITDCDRLDAAFAALEAKGIVSRQNFSCCGTCGSTEIWDEIDAAREAGLPARGYAFFHMQDTESAVEGYGVYLNYGGCDEGAPAQVAIGHEIVAQLNSQGLETDWDGRLERRIGVSLDWKRRRSALHD